MPTCVPSARPDQNVLEVIETFFWRCNPDQGSAMRTISFDPLRGVNSPYTGSDQKTEHSVRGNRLQKSLDHRSGCMDLAAIAVTLVAFLATPTIAQPVPAIAVPRQPEKVVAASPAPPADFAVVRQAVARYFAGQIDYQDGDLISQTDIVKALDEVLLAGWDVPARAALVQRALPDNSFLVKELSTPAGKKFMRRVGRNAGGISRLDRLSAIGGGQQLIRDLIRQKDGDKFVEYLATTAGGRTLGHMVGNARRGSDLNQPTGRIYTADELLAELENLAARQLRQSDRH
jgi:hypothetical protein